MHYGRDAEGDLLNIGALLTPISSAALPKFKSGDTSASTYTVPLTRPSEQSIKWLSDCPDRVLTVARPIEDEALFDRLVALKVAMADFAAHMEAGWRADHFKRLEGLLDPDEWVFRDKMPSVASFKTLMRMIIHNRVIRQPSLGATSDGKFIASWRSGDDRLVIENFASDEVRWVLSRHVNGKRVSAAGTSPVDFLRTALLPYEPEAWFG